MNAMFWVWLSIIIITAGLEFATMEVVSIWFTIGAIIPFILAATDATGWEIQLLLFIIRLFPICYPTKEGQVPRIKRCNRRQRRSLQPFIFLVY